MQGYDRLPNCPKCGAPMIYMVEKERNGSGITKITRYYRCPACGTKVIDEQILIKPVDGVFQVMRLNKSPKIIYNTHTNKRIPRTNRGMRRGYKR